MKKIIIFSAFFLILFYYPFKQPATAATDKKYNICIIPFKSLSNISDEFTKKFNKSIYKMFKQISHINIIPFNQIQESFPTLVDSWNYNNDIRKQLYKKYKIDIIILGDILGKSASNIHTRYRYIIASTGNTLKSGTLISAGVEGVVLVMRKSFPNSLLIEAYKNRVDNVNTVTYRDYPINDGKKKWSFGVIPFYSKNRSALNTATELYELMNRNFFMMRFAQLLPFNKIQQQLPFLKNSENFNDSVRKSIYNKFKLDFIITGSVEGKIQQYGRDFYKARLEITVAYSGKKFTFNLLATNLEGVVKSIFERLTSVRSKMNTIPVVLSKNAMVIEWERELKNIRRNKKFEYSQANESGTLLEEPRNTISYPYYLYLPPHYHRSGFSYPLLVFLHGAGQRSNTLSPIVFPTSPLYPIYRIVRGRPFIDRGSLKNINKFVKSSIVLLPQVPEKGRQSWDANRINKLVIYIAKKYSVNMSRIYVMGVSLGGTGTWRYGNLLGYKLAALVPMCAAVGVIPDPFYSLNFPNSNEALTKPAIWAFHAFDDDVLSYESTTLTIEGIIPGKLILSDRNIMENYPHRNNDINQPANSDCTIHIKNGIPGDWKKGVIYPKTRLSFTLYKSGKHDVWTPTYANPQFWEWLYSQTIPD